MVDPLHDVRVRLEGQLEILEGAIANLEDACAQLDAPAPRRLVDALARELAPETLRALAAARRLDPNPALALVLTRYSEAQAKFAAKVRARLARLRLPPSPLNHAVDAIEAEPIQFARWLVSGAARPVLAGGLVLAGALTLVGAPPMLCLAPLTWFSLFTVRASHVVVTPRRIFIGRESFALAEVKSVERSLWNSPRPYVVEILHAGRRLERRLPCVPGELRRHLKAAGVRLHLWRWFWAS